MKTKTMAANIEQEGVDQCLALCGCSATLIAAITAEGVTRMAELRYIKLKDVADMSKRITGLSVARGGCIFGQI